MPLHIIWLTPKTENDAFLPAIQRIQESRVPDNVPHKSIAIKP